MDKMEVQKLNFNAPLLSVRVKRKDVENPPQCKQLSVPARRSVSPLRHKQLSVPAHKSVSELTEVTRPAAVPFEWERTPGRPKVDGRRESLPQQENLPTPRFPPGRAFDIRKRVSGELVEHQNISRPQMEASLLTETVSVVGTSKGYDSEDGDNAVLESLDALSQTDSFSWSCSISGSSSNDGPFTQSSTTFRADPQTLDLMMARFLPAARAMIIETPKYVQKKKTVESQLPRNVKKVVSGELRPLLERYGSNTAAQYSPCKKNAFSEVEDDEDGNHHRKSGIACGLLPRLSVRKSLSFLDPVPRVKSRPQSPASSASEVRRMARTAHSGPLPQIKQEKHNLKDNYWDDIKIGVKQQELIENKLIGSNQVRHSIDLYRKESVLPRTCSRSACISPYRNEKPRSPFYDGARFLGVPKMVKNTESGNITSKESDKFLDFSAYQMYKRESDLLSSLAERILYIDLVENTELPILDSEEELLKKLSTKNFGESRGTDKTCKPKSLDTAGMVKSAAIGSTAAGSATSGCILNVKSRADNIEVLKQGKDRGHKARSLQCPIVHPAKNLARQTKNSEKVNDEENVTGGFPQSPLPPPLPKSPSEPWLWRNLSSISLRNPFSYGQSKKINPKNSSTSSKWENIVKSSNVSHDHKRYSEELVSHVSKQ